MVEVAGSCDPRYTAVADAFRDNFAQFGEVGAALAVVEDERLVVDVWAGHTDAARSKPWQRDTLAPVASTTKGITGLCVHMLVDRGNLSLDDRVAQNWPEFAQSGKQDVLLRHVLSHQAGIPALDRELPVEAYLDPATVLPALERAAVRWTPGTASSYHALTYGAILGEVVRRATGTSIGRFIQDEVCGPLGVEFYVGLEPALDARTAEFVIELPLADYGQEPINWTMRAGAILMGCTPESRAVENPSGNGHGTANALATIYGALACGGSLGGVTLLSRGVLERSISEPPVPAWPGGIRSGSDPTRWGLGWMHNDSLHMGPNPRTFGNYGGGGSIALADPDRRLALAYIPNKYRPPSRWDPRRRSILDALYSSG